ncbi:hypothetical protein AAMO2058_001294300 [Amorphochlora amoebiformis]
MASVETVQPIKSYSDERKYRVVKLENEIEAILVSDPDTDKAGAALDVHVGHFSDPSEFPGLAHFLEHMLFMGTKTFPDENAYSKLINKHGGRSNAFTSTENTNYYFEIVPEHLEAILELFSGFFTEPLFTPSATEREMKAVHSENAQNLQNDAWRQFQFLKSTSNPNHPFSKFGTGNLETLRDKPKKLNLDTREALLAFHKKLYSANVMKVCILGKESLDDLQKLAVKYFSNVENKSVDRPSWATEPFHAPSLGHLYELVPIKEQRRISILWAFPSLREHYKKKPASLLSHLLGHEGKGSILSALKKKGWANELIAGLSQSTTGFAAFTITIDLTPAGLESYHEIVTLIYQYVKLLEEAADKEWKQAFEESRDVAAMNFRFKGKENPFSFCSSLSGRLQKYKPLDVLEGPWKYETLDIKLVKSLVAKMTPDNMRLHLISSTFKGKTSEKETWYQTEYNKKKIDEKLMETWRAPEKTNELHLPAKNEFIATDFQLVSKKPEAKAEGKRPKTFPKKIVDEKGFVVWHKTDDVFFKPKGYLMMSLASPKVFTSPRTFVLGELYIMATDEALIEFTYDAELASLSYNFTMNKKGFELHVKGYTHKLPVLLYKVVEKIKDFEVDAKVFDRLKERCVRSYMNFMKQQPYRHALSNQARTMELRKWDPMSKIEEAKAVTLKDLKEFAKDLLDYVDLECLGFGNFTEAQTLEMTTKVKDILKCKPIKPETRVQLRSVQLQPGTTYRTQRKGYNVDDPNSCVCALYQIGQETYPILARLSVLGHLISEPAFDQLRTKEQLGYSVFSTPSSVNGSLNLLILVQSPTKGAKYLDDRVEAFIGKFQKDLADMDEKSFLANKTAVIKKKRKKDKKMKEEASRHWGKIVYKRYNFDKVELEVAEIEKLSKKDVLDFYIRYLSISPTRAKLSSQVFGKDHSFPNAEDKPTEDTTGIPPVPKDTTSQVQIGDFDDFVQSMPLFPAYLR